MPCAQASPWGHVSFSHEDGAVVRCGVWSELGGGHGVEAGSPSVPHCAHWVCLWGQWLGIEMDRGGQGWRWGR